MAGDSPTLTTVRFGPFELFPETPELRKDGVRLKLSGQPIQVLIRLVATPGKLVTRQELQQQLWPGNSFGDFEKGLNAAVTRLREYLNDSATDPTYIETIPGRGYRFIADTPPGNIVSPPKPVSRWRIALLIIVTTLGFAVAGMLWRSRQSHKLTEKDTIVLAGFVNSTGDPVFDGALRQGVSAQLAQSPFLNLLSDERVAETLSRLAQPADAQLTHKLASEVCQRTASTATIEGSISRLGKQYVLGLKAINCHNGDLLAEEQVTANDKEQVLNALGDAATRLRKRLGESAVSVQKYDVPLEDVTTPSLEALNAYGLGRKTKDSSSALLLLKRAVELDPNFAMAYRAMAVVYGNLDEGEQAAENARKAYERREKVSERERFSIEISYYAYTTGELEKAAQEAEVLQQTYPKDYWSYVSLSFTSSMLGRWEKALEAALEALRLDPNSAFDYWRVGMLYIQLDRLNEAEALFKQAEERKLDSGDYWPLGRYRLAFFEGDTARMKQLETVAKGKPGIEGDFLAEQADTEAWYGKLKNARELTRQAVNSFERNDRTENAAFCQAGSASLEAELGNRALARAEADAALKLSPNRDVRIWAALALARAGDTVAAEKLAHELEKRFPLDTIVHRVGLPIIRAAVALQRKEPNQAVEMLKVASGIELGAGLIPAYLRGEAYFMLHDGSAAAAEYQKLIDRRGLLESPLWGALARLGMARTFSMQGDSAKAKAAYQDFLTIWKDADPDIPILKKAKTEYAKLQ